MKKRGLITVTLLSLTACASQYAPLTSSSKHSGGYQEWLLNEAVVNSENKGRIDEQNESEPLTSMRYLLRYQGTTSDTKEHISSFWQQRANELCPNGYKVESHRQTIVYGTIRSPVNGRMENLGTQQPIERGVVQCLN
jgi:hypothetical protein